MSTALWILVGVGVWVVVALAVALLLGRIVAQRDRQVPGPPRPRDPEDGPPAPPG